MTAKHWTRYPAVLLICVLLLVLPAACRPVPAPEARAEWPAQPAHDFDRLFQRTGDGWTGGDGTLSAGLPDGRTVWLFGDTFLGTVSPTGQRSADTPFIRNSLVVQKGATLETLFGGTDEKPSAFFNPPAAEQWYWPGHATLEGGRLRIFLHRFEQTEPRLWAFRWVGTELATLSLPSLTLSGIEPTPSANEVLYGVCVLQTESYTYIYGTADLRTPKQAHLARAPAGQVHGPWRYFAEGVWSDQPDASSPILAGVSTQYAVIRACDDFYLFSMDGTIPFSNEIVVYRSAQPSGPWQGPVTIYRAPETDRNVAAYNPFVHPQFSDNNHVLVSYNLNHITDPDVLFSNAAIYRPRFIRVDMVEVARRFHTAGK